MVGWRKDLNKILNHQFDFAAGKVGVDNNKKEHPDSNWAKFAAFGKVADISVVDFGSRDFDFA